MVARPIICVLLGISTKNKNLNILNRTRAKHPLIITSPRVIYHSANSFMPLGSLNWYTKSYSTANDFLTKLEQSVITKYNNLPAAL